jgi:hypothetical protein
LVPYTAGSPCGAGLPVCPMGGLTFRREKTGHPPVRERGMRATGRPVTFVRKRRNRR